MDNTTGQMAAAIEYEVSLAEPEPCQFTANSSLNHHGIIRRTFPAMHHTSRALFVRRESVSCCRLGRVSAIGHGLWALEQRSALHGRGDWICYADLSSGLDVGVGCGVDSLSVGKERYSSVERRCIVFTTQPALGCSTRSFFTATFFGRARLTSYFDHNSVEEFLWISNGKYLRSGLAIGEKTALMRQSARADANISWPPVVWPCIDRLFRRWS